MRSAEAQNALQTPPKFADTTTTLGIRVKCNISQYGLGASLELFLDDWKSYPKLIIRFGFWMSHVARSIFHKQFRPKNQKGQRIQFHSTYQKN